MKKLIKSTGKAIWFVVRSVFSLGHFGVAIVVIGIVAYFFGYPYLTDLKGSDSFYHLSNVSWFGRYFPKIPYWYPLQNGGVVPIWGYPILVYLMVVVTERLTTLSVIGAYQVLGFLSVPLTALGLYLFCWTRLKNQTVGLIGGVLYLLSPIAWVWLFDWGFYTESVSYIFVFPILILYDVFLESYLGKKITVWSRLSLVGAIGLLAVLFLAHPTTFFVTAVIIGSLALFQALDKRPGKMLMVLKRAVIAILAIVVPTLMILSFLILDFYAYSSHIFPAPSKDQKETYIEDYPTPVGSLLGLELIAPSEFKYVHRNIVVVPLVWIPAILGIIAAVIYSRKALALALLSVIPVVLFIWPGLAYLLITKIPFARFSLSHRPSLNFIRFMAPLAAAFGIWGVFKLLLDILTFWIKKGVLAKLKKGIIGLVAGIGALVLAGYLIVNMANKPDSLWRSTEVRYGPQLLDIRDPFFLTDRQDMCKVLQPDDPGRPKACSLDYVRNNVDVAQFIASCNGGGVKPEVCDAVIEGTITEEQLNEFIKGCLQGAYPDQCKFVVRTSLSRVMKYLRVKDNWPRPKLTGELEYPSSRFSDFVREHRDDEMLRIDISPFLGGEVQMLNWQSEISQVNLYAITLSLLEPLWGHEQQVFFSESTGNTVNVNNLAKWFGVKYLLLEDQLDYIPKYEQDSEHWERIDEAGVWEFKEATKLYSWTLEKPILLVIGSEEKGAYEPVYKTSVNGGFNYEDGWLVRGRENVDDYSFKELSKFDTLVLYGYSYRSKTKAYALLDKYVKNGGNLFISTGWQYVDADWELKKAPEFFPIEDLTWSTEYGASSRLVLEDREVGGEVSVSKFSPLSWNDQAWGVSIPVTGKRDWARTVLNVEGKPLVVAGNYGEGKVVWIGWNILGHINTYDFNKEEVLFFGNLLRWFGKGDLSEEVAQTSKLSVVRDHPDEVEFTFGETLQESSVLYWREVEFPRWRARLVDNSGKEEKVSIYRAGPGFMMMILPPVSSGSRLVLEFDPGLITLIGRLVSLFTVIVLLAFVIKGDKLIGFVNLVIKRIKLRESLSKGKMFSWLASSHEEEEY